MSEHPSSLQNKTIDIDIEIQKSKCIKHNNTCRWIFKAKGPLGIVSVYASVSLIFWVNTFLLLF